MAKTSHLTWLMSLNLMVNDGVTLTVHGWVVRIFPMSVGTILTGATLLHAVKPVQEDTAPTHEAWMVEAGCSRVCLEVIGKWTKAKKEDEQNMVMRD